MRRAMILTVAVVGCGDVPGGEPCAGAACGPGARVALTAQAGFGVLRCQGEATDCVIDFGVIAPGESVESWTDLTNTGDQTLQLRAFELSGPVFEAQLPAVELEPGEALSFRVRARLDQASSSEERSLRLESNAVNGASAEGCDDPASPCRAVSILLKVRTDSS